MRKGRALYFLGIVFLLVTVLPRVHAQQAEVPNDPLFSKQWWLDNTGQDGGKPGADIHAAQAWSITRCSPRVTVAVVDTGVDGAHPDLQANLVSGAAYGTGDASTADPHGHGTATAGVVAAVGDNGIGVTGLCPTGHIMPIKIQNIADASYDSINSPPVAHGIRWAVNHGARVVSMSIGVDNSPELKDAAEYAYVHGVVLVAAVGNSGGWVQTYPADEPHVLAVGGTDNQDRRWSGSSYGPNQAFVLAPAVGILTTARGGSYASLSGTSLATPQVAGLAALLFSIRPDLTVDQVQYAIDHGADPVEGQSGYDDRDGWGRIDCYRSLQIAEGLVHRQPVQTPGSTNTPTPPLLTSISLRARPLQPHQAQRLQVTTSPAAQVALDALYSNGKMSFHDGQADAAGRFVYSWRVPAILGKATVTVRISTSDGDLAVARRDFRIRRGRR